MTKVDERMKALAREMRRARMRLSAERMDRRLRELGLTAAARAEEIECGPGEPQQIGQVSSRLMQALGQIARGDVERMSVDAFRKRLFARKLDS